MSLIKPLDTKFSEGDLDLDVRPLQVLPTAHRVALMDVLNGRTPGVSPHFLDPTGVPGFYGFGRDGFYYEGGVQGRRWREQESIDDFTDRVTDAERWVAASGNPDLEEGGADLALDGPYGRRLFAAYSGPVAELYDRKGLMVFTNPTSGPVAALSSRINMPGDVSGMMLENCALLGIQQEASDDDYVFVGIVNTIDFPASIVMGECVAGVKTVTGAVALPPNVFIADVAIVVDSGTGQYQGHYSLALNDEDYTGPSWSIVGAATAFPPGWPSNAVPRFHVAFPPGYEGDFRSFMDVRVEAGGGDWDGQQRATWWLETLDVSRPAADSGLEAACPDELLVVWERDQAGTNHLALVDVTDENNPLLWRRWRNLPAWVPWVREPLPFWSPGWIDAAQGHIIMSRNTGATDTGEIWLFSLRWDMVVVFNVDGFGNYSILNSGTGQIARDIGSWGSRFFYPPTPNEYQPASNYDQSRQPTAGSPFAGTMNNLQSEEPLPAITYGVHGKQANDGIFYVGYGIQQSPLVLPNASPCFAGVIALQEGPSRIYERWLFQRSAPPALWDATSEGWVGVGLTHERALWWHQAIEDDPQSDVKGELCRRNFSALPPDNDSTLPYNEGDSYGGTDRLGSACLNMVVVESNPIGSEFVGVATGWRGGGWGFGLWYNPADPFNSINRTYGYDPAVQVVPVASPDLNILAPSTAFPEWFVGELNPEDAALDVCRITASRMAEPTAVANPLLPNLNQIQGIGIQVAESDPAVWLAYGRHKGQEVVSRTYSLFRGQRLARGELRLEMEAEWTPPWSLGDRFNAQLYLAPNQTASLRLFIEGERGFLGYIEWRYQGQPNNASALVQARARGRWYNAGGLSQDLTASRTLGGWALANKARVSLRIVRQGGVLNFFVYDAGTNDYELVLQMDAPPQSPLLYGMQTTLEDAPNGPACGSYWQVKSFGLNGLGGPFIRPFDRPVLPSLSSSVQGVVASRGQFPTAGSGRLVLAEGWRFAAIPPQP